MNNYRVNICFFILPMTIHADSICKFSATCMTSRIGNEQAIELAIRVTLVVECAMLPNLWFPFGSLSYIPH